MLELIICSYPEQILRTKRGNKFEVKCKTSKYFMLNTDGFPTVMRKSVVQFLRRLRGSSNSLLASLAERPFVQAWETVHLSARRD